MRRGDGRTTVVRERGGVDVRGASALRRRSWLFPPHVPGTCGRRAYWRWERFATTSGSTETWMRERQGEPLGTGPLGRARLTDGTSKKAIGSADDTSSVIADAAVGIPPTGRRVAAKFFERPCFSLPPSGSGPPTVCRFFSVRLDLRGDSHHGQDR